MSLFMLIGHHIRHPGHPGHPGHIQSGYQSPSPSPSPSPSTSSSTTTTPSSHLNVQNSVTGTLRVWEAGSLTLMRESFVDVLDLPLILIFMILIILMIVIGHFYILFVFSVCNSSVNCSTLYVCHHFTEGRWKVWCLMMMMPDDVNTWWHDLPCGYFWRAVSWCGTSRSIVEVNVLIPPAVIGVVEVRMMIIVVFYLIVVQN